MKNFGFGLHADRFRRRSAHKRRAMPMSVETRGSSAPTVRPIHAPDDGHPAAPEMLLWKRRGLEIDRRAAVGHFTRAVAVTACAGPRATEVEAQHGAADAGQRFGGLIHRLWCIVPPTCGCAVREHDGGAESCRMRDGQQPLAVDLTCRRRLVEPRFESPGRPRNLERAWRGTPCLAASRSASALMNSFAQLRKTPPAW